MEPRKSRRKRSQPPDNTAAGEAGARDATKVAVVVPVLARGKDIGNARDPQARLEEAVGLAAAIELHVASAGIVTLGTIRPATYIGSGKVDELAGIIRAEDAGVVFVDCALSPVQQRNLEKAWGAKVVDRTGLILEIFGARARTKEGTLQVELAHLNYQRSRLVRSWTHLERQRGGFGFLGGPGETQIEADRRQIDERIIRIERELESVKRTRALHRQNRKRVPYPVVALVGYTNAGKSTLFNRMTAANVRAEDLLFATLDPTLRGVELPGGTKAILSDTVGFLSELPTLLVAAFRATLEEVIEADLIVHVRDISHPDTAAQATDVLGVLQDLGIDINDEMKIIEVWNKCDRLDAELRANADNHAQRQPVSRRPILISALTGEGIEKLLRAIADKIATGWPVISLVLDPADGANLSWLHRHGEVLSQELKGDDELRVEVRMAPEKAEEFARRLKPKSSAA
ncbi:MAG: GTPase HflX [Xanthobacteraceae bacterium]|nr:GTPase HflX [Xanthobacteraceae bacterium]